MVAKKQLQVEKLVVVELAADFALGHMVVWNPLTGCSCNDEFLSRHYDGSNVMLHCDHCDACGE